MTPARAAVIVAAVAIGSALVVAFVSRTPASVRLARPGERATDPSLGAEFTDEQVTRAAALRGPSYLSVALVIVIELTLLIVLGRGVFGDLVDALERIPGGFVARAAVLGAIVAALVWLATLPLGFVRGYAMAHAWALSTQDVGGWLTDRLRSLAVSVVLAAVTAAAFFAVVRAQPRTWWLWGWAVFSVLTAVFVFVWPVVIAPLFNRFTPLEDHDLRAAIEHLARRAEVPVEEVLVADASRRTTVENAYVAGLGGTKRVVVYDTLLEGGDDEETLFVVAHELGHEVEHHVAKNVVLSSVGLLGGFLVLAWLSSRGAPWSWLGASGVHDLRAIPALLLFATIAAVVTLPVQNAISRRFEARADEIALELTGAPDTAVRVFRRLALSNVSDLRPPTAAVWMLYTHPPVAQRIKNAVAMSQKPP